MKKPLDTITTTDVFGSHRLDSRHVVEVYDSCGRSKGPMKIVSVESTTTMTVRNLRWYERALRFVRTQTRDLLSWLRMKFADYGL